MIYNCHIQALAPQTVIDIKGEPVDVLPRLLRLALTDPPARRTAMAGDLRVLRPSPQHWLLLAPLASEDALLGQLDTPAPAADTLILSVSDAYQWFAISGPEAREVLSIGCPLDLDPGVFTADSATFTEMFALKTLLLADASGFLVAVDRSHAPMVADWFARIQGEA
ncbi:MAG: hypothetical protein RIS90_1173 [Pseudomonadota bacterium]|jgi:sarcosine oxidase subunit gamma